MVRRTNTASALKQLVQMITSVSQYEAYESSRHESLQLFSTDSRPLFISQQIPYATVFYNSSLKR